MAKKSILHMVTPLDNVSAFDVSMAVDAGYDIVVPYTGIDSKRIGDLIQDAIFSRPPGTIAETAVFIGGHDLNMAAEMTVEARAALVPPFELSIFSDPNGAYTTSAALVAKTEALFEERSGDSLKGKNAMIFGGGPVGLSAAILLARCGAQVGVAKLTNSPRNDTLEAMSEHFGVVLQHHDAQTDELKHACLEGCHVVLATAKGGIQVISADILAAADDLIVAADVNAIPPAGIAGVDSMADGVDIDKNKGKVATLGSLAIGQAKYQLQSNLFKDMLSSKEALMIDFHAAFLRARNKHS